MKNEDITFIYFPSGFAIGIPSKAIILFLGNEGEELRQAILAFENKVMKILEKENDSTRTP